MPTHTAQQIAGLLAPLNAELHGNPDAAVSTAAGIEPGEPDALTFIRDANYANKWADSACPVAIATRGLDVPGHDPERRALIYVDDADMGMIAVLQQATPTRPAPEPGVHPAAIIEPGATIDPTARVGPFCHVQTGARVGPRAALVARVTLEPGAAVDEDSHLAPGVYLGWGCTVGKRCLIHANVSIGADGFGFRPSPNGPAKIPHAGTVTIHDDVEIGAGSCVDRAKFGTTTIGAHTKIDNLVQVGHGCRIGKGVIICAQVGLAGSATLEDGVMLGGQAGVSDSMRVGARAQVGAKSGVTRHIEPDARVLGMPAYREMATMRAWKAMGDLPAFIRRELARFERETRDGTTPDDA